MLPPYPCGAGVLSESGKRTESAQFLSDLFVPEGQGNPLPTLTKQSPSGLPLKSSSGWPPEHPSLPSWGLRVLGAQCCSPENLGPP